MLTCVEKKLARYPLKRPTYATRPLRPTRVPQSTSSHVNATSFSLHSPTSPSPTPDQRCYADAKRSPPSSHAYALNSVHADRTPFRAVVANWSCKWPSWVYKYINRVYNDFLSVSTCLEFFGLAEIWFPLFPLLRTGFGIACQAFGWAVALPSPLFREYLQ